LHKRTVLILPIQFPEKAQGLTYGGFLPFLLYFGSSQRGLCSTLNDQFCCSLMYCKVSVNAECGAMRAPIASCSTVPRCPLRFPFIIQHSCAPHFPTASYTYTDSMYSACHSHCLVCSLYINLTSCP
jgi:hypothetical protein